MKKEVIMPVLAVICGILVVCGVSYAVFTTMVKGTKSNVVTSGTLKATFTEAGSVINLTNAYPVTDSVGWNSTAYSFTIKNTGSLDVSYQIKIEENEALYTSHGDASKRFPDNTLKIGLQKTGDTTPSYLSYAKQILADGVLKAGASVTYTMRMWINETAGNEVQGNHFHGKIAVHSSQYYENATVANAPELDDGMIPVVYDEASSSWKKADTSSQWYNYEKQSWANAVTVTSTNRATLLASPAGTSIPMTDINTMWVWIPRYSYTIGNTYGVQGYGGSTPSQATPGAIDIKFVKKTDTLENGSAQYTSTTPANWYTHPAFCFGTLTTANNRTSCDGEEVSGIWISKFELSPEPTEPCASTPTTANCNKSTIMAYSVPNVRGWAYGQIGAYLEAVRNMQLLYASSYGFSSNTYDIHMMKSMEWGAMAFLTQSRYGKYGNTDYQGADKAVYQNKSATHITGSSNGTPHTATVNDQVSYDVKGAGTGASTTGNITGIYDTSGGLTEVMMAKLDSTSGFNTSMVVDRKYYDNYALATYYKGDALITTNPAVSLSGWYGDIIVPITTASPYLLRGGHATGSVEGLFLMTPTSANVSSVAGMRAVLKP